VNYVSSSETFDCASRLVEGASRADGSLALERDMRFLLVCASSVVLLGSAALADEVTVTHDQAPGVVIEHRAADVPADSMREKTITRDSNGCATKTIKKTNGDGDSVTKSKTNC
jgi:hypothetical protein